MPSELPIPAANPTPANHVTGKPLADDEGSENYAVLQALEGGYDPDDSDSNQASQSDPGSFPSGGKKHGKIKHIVEEIRHLLKKLENFTGFGG